MQGFTADCSSRGLRQEVTFVVQDDKLVGLDGVQVKFDDERVVGDAGIALVATLALRLGIEELAGDLVRLRRDRPGAANAGRKVMALLFAMVLGADSIDDSGVLRAGRTGWLLGGWIPAPSTPVGTPLPLVGAAGPLAGAAWRASSSTARVACGVLRARRAARHAHVSGRAGRRRPAPPDRPGRRGAKRRRP